MICRYGRSLVYPHATVLINKQSAAPSHTVTERARKMQAPITALCVADPRRFMNERRRGPYTSPRLLLGSPVLIEIQEVDIMQKRASSDIGRLLSVLFAALAGLYLLIGGIWLTAIGGAPYYVISCVVMLVTAALLYRRRAIALGLYALLLLCTIVWGVWEAGFDFWALTPRLDVLV